MENKTEVIVYSTQGCPWCFRAKQFLKDHGIKYIEKNVADDDAALQEMLSKTGGYTQVPVIDIKGIILKGFDEAKLREVLKIK